MHTDKYAVVGNPIAHSLSPRIHRLFAAQFGEQIDYQKVTVPLGGFAAFADSFFAQGGRGLNITVPFKQDACAYVSQLEPLARSAQAVNTIYLQDGEQGRSVGCNTDGIGLLADLTARYQQPLQGRHIMILGAGGAARGVLAPLLSSSPARLTIVNRTVAKARQLAKQFAPTNEQTLLRGLSYEEIEGAEEAGKTDTPADIIINATSSAHRGQAVPLASRWLENAFCYDMNYAASAAFMRWAAAEGAARSVDGLGMLVEQAAAAYQIWRGRQPQTEPVYQTLRRELG